MKNLKSATIVIVAIAIIYVIVLAFVNVPVQTKVVILLSDNASLMTKLPFSVSYWWNLLLFPIYLLAIVYAFNQEKIVGEKPSSSKGGIKEKFHVRGINWMINVLFLVLSLGSFLPGIIVGFFFQSAANTFGPLSFITISIQLFFICHIVFGAGVEFLWTLFKDTYCEYDSYIEFYQARSMAYIKNGIIRSLPYLIGATIAFMIRFCFESIFSFFKKVKISIEKEERSFEC